MTRILPAIAPYADVHQDVQGPGDARPSALQIIQDQNLIGKMGELNVAITGGNSGIGKETTRALHATGARIFILVLPGVDGDSTAKEIALSNEENFGHQVPLQPIEVIEIDLASFSSVKNASHELKRVSGNRLHIMVCNAGVMSPPFMATKDGFEPHFGINFLGHFLLFNELAETLVQTGRQAGLFAPRVIIVSSLGHRSATVDFDDFPPEVRDSATNEAAPHLYHESKTELLWMSNEIERRFASRGIHSLSLNPGSIPTPLTAHIGWDKMREHMGNAIAEFDRLRKNVEQGAATTVWAAVGRELEGKGGFYLDDVRVALPARENTPMFTHGYAPHAYDEEGARKLWKAAATILAHKGFAIIEN